MLEYLTFVTLHGKCNHKAAVGQYIPLKLLEEKPIINISYYYSLLFLSDSLQFSLLSVFYTW